jgi:hypothetical protein
VFAPFRVDASQYAANMLSVNITNVPAKATTTSSSSGTTAATATGKTLFALLALCALSVVIVV